MAVKKIITDEILLTKKSVDIDLDSEQLGQVINDLIDTAEFAKTSKMGCAGLAANQIGYNFRICVVMLGAWFEPIINPEVVKRGGRVIKGLESCLSRPGKQPIEKMRFKRIKIKYTDMDGKSTTKMFHNFDARALQHEMDHFEGKLI